VTRTVCCLFLFTLLTLGVLPACRGATDTPPPPPPPGVPINPVAPAPPPVAPAAVDQPCIVGRWQANDFLQMVRANMRANLQGEARLTAAGGTITFEFAPPDAEGNGQMVASAEDLVHQVRARQSKVTVTGTHTMSGQATMAFRTLPPDVLVLDPPTESSLSARVNIRATGGLRFNRSSRPRVDLSGHFAYECTGDELRVWQRRGGNRRGSPVVFDRAPAEQPEPP